MLFDSYEEEESVSYWPSAADLFMTLFIISIAAIAAVMVALLPTSDFSDQEAINNAVGTDMAKIRKPVGKLRSTLKLPAISPAAKPNQVITKLGETCVVAIEQLEILSSNDLAGELEKLQAELALLGDENDQLRSKNVELASLNAKLVDENSKLTAENKELVVENTSLKKRLNELKDIDTTIVALKRRIIILEDENQALNRQLNDKPPIITLTGSADNSDDPDAPAAIVFSSGKATLQNHFITDLEEKLFPKVGKILEKYTTVDTLEIVGHTDGSPVSSKSNLDESIASHFAGNNNFSTMTAGSNCDLGLMRALAIRKAWKDWLRKVGKSHLNERINVRCYSAAQTVPPIDSKAANDPSVKSNWLSPNQDARRIEIRFTQLKTQ